MRWFTHAIFSMIITVSLLNFLKFNIFSLKALSYIIFSAIVSTFPDVDIRRSNIFEKVFYYIFFLPFAISKKRIPHRKITHSFFFMLLTSTIFLFLDFILNSYFFLIYILSYSSHIFLDSLTPAGVQIFSPLSKKRISWKIKTNSSLEYLFLFSIFTIFYLLSTFNLEKYMWAFYVILFAIRVGKNFI